MRLTQVERQILYNQNRILSIICPEEKDSYELNMTILLNGYTSDYEEVFEVYDDEVEESECQFVYHVLTMYRSLCFSYQKLDNKSGITNDDVLFQGFDGNDETKYYSFASYLLKEKKRFEEFKNVDTNSHSRKVEIYKSMLDVYNSISNEKNNHYSNSLTRDEIISIINAWRS